MINQKCSKQTPCLDIISNLPDEILCHILSFLPTKSSVATSILSRRWRFLWTHVMSINICNRADKIRSDIFSDVVDTVFLKNTARRINTFDFSVNGYCTQNQFDTWIRQVVARNVRSINLDVCFQYTFPQCLFSAKTLVECTLDTCRCVCDVPAIRLPNLKKLFIRCVAFVSQVFLAELISGCLALEELRLEDTWMGSLSSISIPTLKRLSLDSLCYFESMVKLNTPALQYLIVIDFLHKRVLGENLSSLVEAEIVLYRYSNEEDNISNQQRYVLQLVDSISTVKCLKLSCTMEMNLLVPQFAVKFSNLIKLDFKGDWRFLARLLERADKLQVLIITKAAESLSSWRDPEKVPECLLSCLKTVTIHYLGDREMPESDLLMVRYILSNAKLLKRMEIHSRFYIYRPDERFNISLFPRVSEACEVAIFAR